MFFALTCRQKCCMTAFSTLKLIELGGISGKMIAAESTQMISKCLAFSAFLLACNNSSNYHWELWRRYVFIFVHFPAVHLLAVGHMNVHLKIIKKVKHGE